MTRPTEHGPVPVPAHVLQGLEAVRRSGLTNMLDCPAVARLAVEMGFVDAGRWVQAHRARYARGVFHGFTAEADRATDCPCGCEGRYDDHDERGCPTPRPSSERPLRTGSCGSVGAP